MNKALSDKEYGLLQSLVKLSQDGLRQSMGKFLRKKYKQVVETKDYIYAVGNIPIALVAHMDTVFKVQPQNDEIFYDKEKGVIWSSAGLGADDRAGIFAIVQILYSQLRPSIILTTGEEKGGIGAEAFISDFKEPIQPLKYIIELDRRGADDCVFYNCDNDLFIDYVETFGFELNWGSFTDISVICPKWGVAGVNLSVGYQDEHSVVERLYVRHLKKTISRVTNMLKLHESCQFFKYIPCKYDNLWDFAEWYTKNKDWSWVVNVDQCQCEACKMYYDDDEVIEAISAKDPNKKVKFCIDCAADLVEWCTECGEAYESQSNGTGCPRCGNRGIKANSIGIQPDY